MYKATALAKPVNRFGAVSLRLDGDERALKNAQKRAEKTAKLTRLINETVGEFFSKIRLKVLKYVLAVLSMSYLIRCPHLKDGQGRKWLRSFL